MTDNFKNLIIEYNKDEKGRPVSIVLPISKNTLEIEYDENSNLSSKASCTSWFEVCFSYEFDTSINEFSYNIESFEFINF